MVVVQKYKRMVPAPGFALPVTAAGEEIKPGPLISLAGWKISSRSF